jgi:hypothetical protein
VNMHRVFVGGRVHIRRHRCSTCIFGPNSPVPVQRRDGMIAQCGDTGVIPCHHHLYDGRRVEPVCRGFADLGVNWVLRLAEAMDVVTLVGDDEP